MPIIRCKKSVFVGGRVFISQRMGCEEEYTVVMAAPQKSAV